MNSTIQHAINDQIHVELSSAYFYLSAVGYFENANLAGFAKWMRVQAQEEVGHAMRFFDFVNDRGSRVTLQSIEQPPNDFASPLDVFTRALQHERTVTTKINTLYALAVQESDYPAQVLLQWFISEQVEEEKNASRILEELKMAGENPSALLLLDNNIGARRTAEAAPEA
ncbi:MAG TPA: ferritin [Ktedonobacterales bacterium]|nr:ferritin [Ktedonobacterales bacterium]